MLSLHEVIDRQLERLDTLFVEEGHWTGEDYSTMVEPLHEALRALAEKDDNTPTVPPPPKPDYIHVG